MIHDNFFIIWDRPLYKLLYDCSVNSSSVETIVQKNLKQSVESKIRNQFWTQIVGAIRN